MRGEMTWVRIVTLGIAFSMWFLCFLTFLFRGWKKRRRDGKDIA